MGRALDPAAVRALVDAVEAADGVAPFSEQTLLDLAEATLVDPNLTGREQERPEGVVGRALAAVSLPVEERGVLVGYAQLDRGSAELAVHPEHRRRGVGSKLLDRVLESQSDARVWAHGPHPGAAPLAASRGLAVVRELWLMSAPPPSDAPLPEPPDGVVLTTFDADRDADDWLAVNARAFASHPEQGRMNRADLDARLAEPWFDPDGFWLARDRAGVLLGSMWTKIESGVGEIYVLGIDPAAQGRGLGGLLTATAMHRFAQQPLTEVELYVEGDNHAAIRTYQRAGFRRRRADVQYARG